MLEPIPRLSGVVEHRILGGTTLPTLRNDAASLAYLLSGSLNLMTVAYWIDSFNDIQEGKWQSIVTSPDVFRTIMTNEMSAFAKDDWKISRNLTLNLGVRWEYYGAAYIREGFTATPVDQGLGVFGVSRGPSGGVFDSWLVPGANPVFLSGYGANRNGIDCAAVHPGSGPGEFAHVELQSRKPDDNRVCWSRLSASGKNGCSQ